MGGRSARRSWRIRGLTLVALLAGAACWPAASSVAENEQASLEYRVKAAFLYKIAGYVEWPKTAFPKPDTPITIGVMGAEPLAEELSRVLIGRTAHNRPVAAKRLAPGQPLDGVHVLFVGREASGRLSAIAEKARRQSILLVSETEDALANGSMINFVIVDGRVKFEVLLEAAQKSDLKLSSRLLTVAHAVHREVR